MGYIYASHRYCLPVAAHTGFGGTMDVFIVKYRTGEEYAFAAFGTRDGAEMYMMNNPLGDLFDYPPMTKLTVDEEVSVSDRGIALFDIEIDRAGNLMRAPFSRRINDVLEIALLNDQPPTLRWDEFRDCLIMVCQVAAPNMTTAKQRAMDIKDMLVAAGKWVKPR